MSPNQQRYIRIDEVAALTGHTADELRRWCATGRLRAEPIDGEWYVLEQDIHDVAAIEQRLHARGDGRSILALAFSDADAGRLAYEELRSGLGLDHDTLSMGPLALDGRRMLMIAGLFPDARLDWVAQVTRRHGGIVVERIEESAGEGAARRARAAQKGSARDGFA